LLEEEHYTLKEETLIGRERDMQRERDRKIKRDDREGESLNN
jgi:hypothetical protein